jgi:cytochrome c553
MNKQLIMVAVLGLSVGAVQAADVEAGKAKAGQICLACHGLDGIGLQPIYPNIRGQKEAYMVSQLKAFKSGDRKNPIMSPMAMQLATDADIENVAAYYSGLK